MMKLKKKSIKKKQDNLGEPPKPELIFNHYTMKVVKCQKAPRSKLNFF